MAPESLTFAGDASPCVRHACRKCCFDTEMPLLPADIERLSGATGRDPDTFRRFDTDGIARLQNTDGHCVFLGAAGCSVYDDRPAGCRLYPLVLDPEGGQGVLDPDCPYTRAFRIRPRDRAALAAVVAALGLDDAAKGNRHSGAPAGAPDGHSP